MGRGRNHCEALQSEYSKKSQKHLKLNKFFLEEKLGLRRNWGIIGKVKL